MNSTLIDSYILPVSDFAELPKVSVVIPVFNGAPTLLKLLDSISAQSYPSDRIEIIVVDNGSTDDTVELIKNWEKSVVLMHEEKRGSYAARNTGIVRATGEFIAFTDADCAVDPNWLLSGVRCLQKRQHIGLVAGNIKLVYSDNPTIVELYEIQNAFHQEKYVRKRNFGATANLLVRCEVFQRVGYFDESLRSGGDLRFCNNAVEKGEIIEFCKEALVYHRARRDVGQMLKKTIRVGVGWGMMTANGTMPSAERSKGRYAEVEAKSRSSELPDQPWSKKYKLGIFKLLVAVVFNAAFYSGFCMQYLRKLKSGQKKQC